MRHSWRSCQANTQGATLDEARENLTEAVEMMSYANRELAEQSLRGEFSDRGAEIAWRA
jgi:predicted RNase H-like HicB family nuclease